MNRFWEIMLLYICTCCTYSLYVHLVGHRVAVGVVRHRVHLLFLLLLLRQVLHQPTAKSFEFINRLFHHFVLYVNLEPSLVDLGRPQFFKWPSH